MHEMTSAGNAPPGSAERQASDAALKGAPPRAHMKSRAGSSAAHGGAGAEGA